MIKKLITSLLLILIGLTFFIVYLKIQFLKNEENLFNQHWRPILAKNVLLRNFFKLHFDGDAKGDYLGNKSSKILLEIHQMEGVQLDRAVIEKFSNKINEITGKQTEVYYTGSELPFAESFNQKERDALKLNRIHKASQNMAVIYLYVGNQEYNNSTKTGSTLEENGIIIYPNVFNNFLNNQIVSDRYILSTLLHEFGHQLGLSHNDIEGCLMNPTVEVGMLLRLSQVPIDFCQEELKMIKK